ncbi:hypothetical protein [Sphingomonas sp. LHG3406-1]|uniref:hypothetical protein n=1 Tax=Sphingomonas sp. LHG3406-1 TaxID=2804617 RepID=UPI00261A5061|nr:hypothetical protein [Sphingomonas sp. LHG3406-1]
MSRLAPAIRHRRRLLDALALRISAEEREQRALGEAAESLTELRRAERHLAAAVPLAADAWFADSARRLEALGAARKAGSDRLAALRRETAEARGRLQLLEDAAAVARKAERRAAERRAQAALDDSTAAAWSKR